MPKTSPDGRAVDLHTIDFDKCALFQNVLHAERQEILNLMERQTFPRGDTILREGRSIQILWIILRGNCEVIKSTKTGGTQRLAVLEPLNVFGEMSFYHPAPHSASVRALTEVDVLRLPREKFDELLESGSTAAVKLALNTVGVLAERLRKMDDWTCDLVEKPGAAQHREEWQEFRARLYTDWQF